MALGGLAISTLVGLTSTKFDGIGGWNAVSAVDRATAETARVAPADQPFVLSVKTQGRTASGFDPRFYGLATRYFGPSTAGNNKMPVVTVWLSGSLTRQRVVVRTSRG